MTNSGSGPLPALRQGKRFTCWPEGGKREARNFRYRFAAPDGAPSLFSLCIDAFPVAIIVVWI